MLSLFYKFFKESFHLVDYISSYYLSNIIIISFLQLLFFCFVYNVINKIKTKLKETNKNFLIKNNTYLIKNILTTYHNEQINTISKIFDNIDIQQLFFEKIFNNENNILSSNTKDEINDEMNEDEKINNTVSEKVKDDTNIMYPTLPNSPIDKNE